MERPEDYRWNSLGYHIQTGNKDDFLSLDFGLIEFGLIDAQERLKRYRRYVYEAGALNCPDKRQAPEECAPLSQVNSTGQTKVIDNATLKKEQNKNYEISRADRFRYRTRYFADSGIIGTKEFVSENYQRFKGVFMSKREKIPRQVAGLNGVFSLKRLVDG